MYIESWRAACENALKNQLWPLSINIFSPIIVITSSLSEQLCSIGVSKVKELSMKRTYDLLTKTAGSTQMNDSLH